MTRYGFVASGGGYRSFYSEGVLVWMKRNGLPVVHISSTSSGNNIVVDYLLWDWQREELPPVLTRTVRLNVTDIFHIFSNFLGLRPQLLPTGTHLFTVDKKTCRKSLLLDDPQRRELLAEHLRSTRWDIRTTNLSQRQARSFSVNEILGTIDDSTLDAFMDVFLAGITTLPYFRAITLGGDYYIEGGYLDNTPLRTLFADDEVDEIVAVDFTDYDYHRELDKLYRSTSFILPFNSIDTHLLVSDMQLTLPNTRIFEQARLINEMLGMIGKESAEVSGRRYYRKPLHVLRPKDLESMTISLKDSSAQKRYFELGQQEAAALFGENPSLNPSAAC
ncbi:patatin-like phospholipase family protein [Accumulibacter sp.]|uniref:patatin-like phospholipase family protein n=1 Tax=Accumulibacter sp. TaxID=2053492 RepID=UPI0025EBC46C|nr:patatin-like phospholipase family protein [Accumulibacter sp.]MCM8596604.1 patatin-like phospholipase family protein [Accumulibacter sp.]MCM8627523.1 patatin-like phospholipase family protein [Accumulibacter sp.]MDS4050752.1 patatin-like phospholipase family protein [Accumulibacter sp.]